MKRTYLILALIILALVSLFIGVKTITPSQLIQMEQDAWHILLTSRIPRLISLVLAGVGMSLTGVIMQQISRNKFVSPTTSGTEDSAKLGVLVAMLLFGEASTMGKMLIAFLFALLGTFLFMYLLKHIPYKNAIFIPLLGLMLGNVIDSITTFLAYKKDLIQNVSSWLQGDFSMIIEGRYELLYISIPLVAIAYLYANQFTLAGMGEDFAKNLGLKYNQVVNIGLGIVALIAASVVITVGKIPFLGLIIPNMVTLYKGDNLKKSMPDVALLGAVFLLACDIIGRVVIFPYEIPIGLTVGVIGSGIFLYMLLRRKRA